MASVTYRMRAMRLSDTEFEIEVTGTKILTIKVPVRLNKELDKLPSKSDFIRSVISKIISGEAALSPVRLDGPKEVVSVRIPLEVFKKLKKVARKSVKEGLVKSRNELLARAIAKELGVLQ